jgi:DNA topoisomerase III
LNSLENNEQREVYKFVVRRFLACCSQDAKGEKSEVELQLGAEHFHTSGLRVLERNYLDVYPYEKWESSQELPQFIQGETFEPTEMMMNDGKTSPPGYLTEPELIALMDANGIGTDATMAEHIAKIIDRSYVMTQSRGGGLPRQAEDGGNRGSTRGRGRGRGRGGRGGGSAPTGGSGGTNNIQEFIPSTLGVALVEGYDSMGFNTSLSKPFLRKEVRFQATFNSKGIS